MNEPGLIEFAEHGSDGQRGNLLGVQPYMRTSDYASEEAFFAKLDGYMQAARGRGWLGPRTIVVWPEYIGTWLASTGEGPAVAQAATLNGAMRRLAAGHALRFAGALLRSREQDRVSAALFRVQAEAMARSYQAVFSRLARQYAVTMAAGSIMLPAPEVRAGAVAAGSGPIYSVSAVFRPDGTAHPELARKTAPTTAEASFVTAATAAELPVFDTPAGRLGVLICADAWYPEPYARLKAGGAELVAVPSFVTADAFWDKPWGGYDGAPTPAGVDAADVGVLSAGQAWRKYALAGRLALSGARHGINVFLRGALWDLGPDSGTALAVSGDQVAEAGRAGAAIMSVWV